MQHRFGLLGGLRLDRQEPPRALDGATESGEAAVPAEVRRKSLKKEIAPRERQTSFSFQTLMEISWDYDDDCLIKARRAVIITLYLSRALATVLDETILVPDAAWYESPQYHVDMDRSCWLHSPCLNAGMSHRLGKAGCGVQNTSDVMSAQAC